MLDPGLLAFARGVLPPPPARILEIGAGNGELAAALREGGHEVTAIDPAAEDGTGVEATSLIDATGTYDAAVAVVSLHHVEPLEASCARLAELIVPGGVLAIDELDVGRYDERVTAWWLHQRRAAGHEDDHTPESILEGMRNHIHPLDVVREALAPHFALGEPVRGPYLHRWHLPPGLRESEERLIGAGRLPAVGARMVGVSTGRPAPSTGTP
jgi:SAM-dependent methyltransferase